MFPANVSIHPELERLLNAQAGHWNYLFSESHSIRRLSNSFWAPLTSIALQKPQIFERQLKRAREILTADSDVETRRQIESRLRTEGFYSKDIHKILREFYASIHPDDEITSLRVMEFLMRLNAGRSLELLVFRIPNSRRLLGA